MTDAVRPAGRRCARSSPADFAAWQEVRRRNDDWLTPWEPARMPGLPDVVESARGLRHALQRPRARAPARHRVRVRHLRADRRPAAASFCGEINLSSVQRGPFQSAYVGYWIDQAQAGHGYMPEALVVVARFAFEELRAAPHPDVDHPPQPRSRRVVEKLKLRDEGIAQRYLEINGCGRTTSATPSRSRSGTTAATS